MNKDILIAIVWTMVGAMLMLFITILFWNIYILPDMYNTIEQCWETKKKQ